jgi:hypothetical protein
MKKLRSFRESRPIVIGARGAMQKEKPLFEGIPNCGKTVQFLQNRLIEAN